MDDSPLSDSAYILAALVRESPSYKDTLVEEEEGRRRGEEVKKGRGREERGAERGKGTK